MSDFQRYHWNLDLSKMIEISSFFYLKTFISSFISVVQIREEQFYEWIYLGKLYFW